MICDKVKTTKEGYKVYDKAFLLDMTENYSDIDPIL